MRILVRLGHLYHLASVEPVARAFASRGHDLEFCCVEESERVFGFPISKRKKAERELSDRGYVIAKNFSGFDVVLTGDFLPDPENFFWLHARSREPWFRCENNDVSLTREMESHPLSDNGRGSLS